MTRRAIAFPGLMLLLLPALAAADCKHSEPRELSLDLQGVATVRIEVNSHELRLASAGDGPAVAKAIACVSDPDYYSQLAFAQVRTGDTLVIRAERDGASWGVFFRPTYARLQLDIRLPAGLAYEVEVGSGDAWVQGLENLGVDVGSGDLDARDIAGRMQAEVGSGDITVSDVGELHVRSVGSGDLVARRVRGDVRVDDIGSGDVELRGVGGSVEAGEIGSGDLAVSDVEGDLTVRRIGSGDVSQARVKGRVELPDDH